MALALGPAGLASSNRAHGPARTGRRQQMRVTAALSLEHIDAADASTSGRRQLMSGIAAGLVAASLAMAPASDAATAGFLSRTGAKGPLVDEEEYLVKLRQEKEGEVRRELEEERMRFEEEASKTQAGKLCATPFGIDIVGITEVVALIGALVGGITARQRKQEVEKLNEQLRKINMSLRQQARAGTMYAPGLQYAPLRGNGSSPSGGNGASASTAVLTLPAEPSTSAAVQSVNAAGATAAAQVSTMFSMDEAELTSDQIQCRDALRAGKRLLKESNGAAAMVRFEKALMLSKALGDKVQERRAVRGLAAAARLQSQYRTAIKNLERVLEISKEMKEYTGDADAYGVIADCYTDLGEFEKAAEYYDKYIGAMNRVDK